MPDFYEVLQVSPRAEPEVIRAAYRTLARKYHPDHGGDARRMIDLNDAWDVLGDPNRRAAYDASRTASRTEASRPPAPRAPMSPTPPPPTSPSPTRPPAPTSPTWPQPATPREAGVTHAGPPPGNPSGTVLDFGRYAGWSLGEIARRDVDYLEWLQRATFGRKLRAEIDALLRQRTPAAGRTPFGQQGSRRR
jgi:curved DNA-binding protein CbpA